MRTRLWKAKFPASKEFTGNYGKSAHLRLFTRHMKCLSMLVNRPPEGRGVAGKFARENREFGSPEQGSNRCRSIREMSGNIANGERRPCRPRACPRTHDRSHARTHDRSRAPREQSRGGNGLSAARRRSTARGQRTRERRSNPNLANPNKERSRHRDRPRDKDRRTGTSNTPAAEPHRPAAAIRASSG